MMTKKAKLALLMAVILPLGCAREETAPDIVEGGIPLNIDGSIAQVPTRATGSGFEGGDQIGLYAVNYSENNTVAGTLVASGNQADNAKYTYNAETLKWTTVRPVYYKDANTHADLYVYYPYQRNIGDVEAYTFEVAKDQTTAEADGILGGYEASDLLWCKVTDVAPTKNKVQVHMQHRMAGARVNLVEGTGFGVDEFASVSKSVILLNTTRKATVNFRTGAVSKVGDPQADGIVMCPQQDGSWRAVVVPQTISNVYLFAITIDGQTYRYRQGSNPINYTAGHITGFAVTINKISPSGDYTFDVVETGITAWTEDTRDHVGEARQYYVVNVETPGTLGATITSAGKNPDRIRNLKVTGTVNGEDFYFMRDHMAILEAVNMKECSVVDAEYYIAVPGSSSERVVADNVIPAGAFKGKRTLLSFVFPDSIRIIGGGAFSGTLLSGNLVLPNDLKEMHYLVGNYVHGAFEGTQISSVELPHSLTYIGRWTFGACSSLGGVCRIPSSVRTIGGYAFYHCAFSGPLHLPEQLEELGDHAFDSAGSFSGSLHIPDAITAVPDCCFNNAAFSGTLDLNNATTVGAVAFGNCGFYGELVIPEGTTIISTSSYSYNHFTSVSFPSTTREIQQSSFYGNETLMGDLVFPEGTVYIGSNAFSGCRQINSLEFPSTLTTVYNEAFAYCYNVSRMIVHSTETPVLQSGVFNGIGRDNCVIEVPESSLAVYRTEAVWNEFKRIQAYRNFGISRRLMRALNAEKTRTCVLRCPSNASWSVTSKPDWVTVSPNHGMGKTEITVTISAMARTEDTFEREEWNGTELISVGVYKGRKGSIVFEMDDKEASTQMELEQYDYQYGDGETQKGLTHSKGSGLHLVFMGDGYDAKDIASGTFLADMEEAAGYFFDVEPYSTYKDYFDVDYVIAESDESGIETQYTVVDNKFGSKLSFGNLLLPDVEDVFAFSLNSGITAGDLPSSVIVLIINTPIYEGKTFLYGDGSAIAMLPKSQQPYPYDFRGLVQHEVGGHGFGKLGDEYIYHPEYIFACNCLCCDHGDVFNMMKARGWYRNLEFTGNMYDVAWSHLIFNPDYSDKVDIYEGGYMHNRGVFRSEATSCMNNNIPYYSAISRQAMVERILTLSGEGFTMQKFYDNDSFRVGSVSRFGRRSLSHEEMLQQEVHYSHDHGPVYMGESPILK